MASRLHDSSQDLLGQLQKAAEEFRSYARKLELSVGPEQAGALGLATRLRKLERHADKVRAEGSELQKNKQEILLAAKEALLGTAATLTVVEAKSGMDTGVEADGDTSLTDLSDAISQWQSICTH